MNLIELTNKINSIVQLTPTSPIDSDNDNTNTTEDAYTLGDYYLMRGGLLKKACYYKEAMNDFKNASNPANRCHDLFGAKLEYATFLTLLTQYDEAMAIFEELLEKGDSLSQQPNWINFYAKYVTALTNTNTQKAKELADKIVQMYPNERDIHIAKGSVYYQLKNNAQAIEVVFITSSHYIIVFHQES